MAQRNRTSPVNWPAGIHYQRTDRTSRSHSAGEEHRGAVRLHRVQFHRSNSLVRRWRSVSKSGRYFRDTSRRRYCPVASTRSVGQSRISAATCCIVNLAQQPDAGRVMTPHRQSITPPTRAVIFYQLCRRGSPVLTTQIPLHYCPVHLSAL